MALSYCGEWHELSVDATFTVGRRGDLAIDDNPLLQDRFLELALQEDMWWLSNVGSTIPATVSDTIGGMQAAIAPGDRLPIVFGRTRVVFTAGPTTYEFDLHLETPAFRRQARPGLGGAAQPNGHVRFTDAQKAIIVALAEPLLRQEGAGISAIPSSAQAAERLGWALTRFNRKLDNVCAKLDRAGVEGLRGSGGSLATNRRARLVEHAITFNLVTSEDLELLERMKRRPDDS